MLWEHGVRGLISLCLVLLEEVRSYLYMSGRLFVYNLVVCFCLFKVTALASSQLTIECSLCVQ